MYKLTLKEYGVIIRLSDGVSIPYAEDNYDYKEYLKWLGEGNTPEPADPAVVDDMPSLDEKIDALLEGGSKLAELKARIAAKKGDK